MGAQRAGAFTTLPIDSTHCVKEIRTTLGVTKEYSIPRKGLSEKATRKSGGGGEKNANGKY
jgi:hypothetical protein